MADPPGLSIRRTTATTLGSSEAFLRVSIMVVEPSDVPLNRPLRLLPSVISPTA